MRGRPAHVKILNWCAVLGPPRRWPQEEELFEGQLALEYISLGETKVAFQVQWSQYLPVDYQVFNVWRMLCNRINNGVAKLFALFVPRSFFQVIWRVLNKARHNMFARRRYRRVGQTWNDHIDVRASRKPSVLRFVVSALHVIDGR